MNIDLNKLTTRFSEFPNLTSDIITRVLDIVKECGITETVDELRPGLVIEVGEEKMLVLNEIVEEMQNAKFAAKEAQKNAIMEERRLWETLYGMYPLIKGWEVNYNKKGQIMLLKKMGDPEGASYLAAMLRGDKILPAAEMPQHSQPLATKERVTSPGKSLNTGLTLPGGTPMKVAMAKVGALSAVQRDKWNAWAGIVGARVDTVLGPNTWNQRFHEDILVIFNEWEKEQSPHEMADRLIRQWEATRKPVPGDNSKSEK